MQLHDEYGGKSRLKQSGSHIASEVSHSTVKGVQVISQELTAIVETCKVAELRVCCRVGRDSEVEK